MKKKERRSRGTRRRKSNQEQTSHLTVQIEGHLVHAKWVLNLASVLAQILPSTDPYHQHGGPQAGLWLLGGRQRECEGGERMVVKTEGGGGD